MLYKVNSKAIDIPIGTVVEAYSETENTITLKVDENNSTEPNTKYGLRTYPREYFALPDFRDNIIDIIQEEINQITWVEDIQLDVKTITETEHGSGIPV